jgi:hypothetical protein
MWSSSPAHSRVDQWSSSLYWRQSCPWPWRSTFWAVFPGEMGRNSLAALPMVMGQSRRVAVVLIPVVKG